MLRAVARLMTGKGDDAAALQQQLEALKREGAEASAQVDTLKAERAAAASYDEARDLDDRIARQIWITQHCAAALPGLEMQLAAARAIDQAAAVARWRGTIGAYFPRLRDALRLAGKIQAEAIKARQMAAAEVGEPAVALNIPFMGYRGLVDDELIGAWCAEQERVWAAPARNRPRPAALPAPAVKPKPKPPVAVAREPAPRAKRVVRRDPFPTDGQGQALVVFLRAGVEIGDGTTAAIGDQVSLPAEQARTLAQRGVVDYVTTAAASEEKAGG